jgi:predicted DNA-binding transcriptional regulator AlpA
MDAKPFTNVGAATHAAIHQFNRNLKPEWQNLKPEWLRVPEATRVFGLCRSSLYALIAEGKIKSTAFKKRGALRGIRLISYDSLAQLIEQAANEEGNAK